MALAEVDPNLHFEAQMLSERELQDVELMQAREVTARTFSPEMLDRILPFYSPADALVERQLAVYDLEHAIVPGLTATVTWGWTSILRQNAHNR